MKQHVFHVKIMSDSFCDPMVCIPPGSSVHGFPRQKYWSGLSFPPAGDLPDPGIEPMSPVAHTLQADSLPLSHWHLRYWYYYCYYFFFVLCCQPVSPIYEQPTQALNHGKCEQWHGALWIPGFTSCRPSTSLGSSTIMLSSSPLYGISRILACTSSSDTNWKLSVCFIICTGLLVSCNKFMCKRMPSEH